MRWPFGVCLIASVALVGACRGSGDGDTSSNAGAWSGGAGGGLPQHPVVHGGDGGAAGGDASAPCAWTPYNDGLVGGYVSFVAYDPRASGVAWAASGDHVYRSEDHGQTWSFAGEAPASVNQIALPGDSPSHLVAATTSGVASSTDGGASWTLALDGLNIVSILAHPADPLRVYAGTLGAGILRSDDGGATFSPSSYGLPYAGYLWLDGDPADVDTVLVSFELLASTGTSETAGGVLITTDGGHSWVGTSGDTETTFRIARCAGTASQLYAAAVNGLLGSTDGGRTWTPVVSEFDEADVAVSPSSCDTVYRTQWGTGTYRSTDGAATFAGPLTKGIPFQNAFPREVSVNPSDPSRLLGTTPGGLLCSADGGNTWSLVGGMMGLAVRALASSPTSPDRLWMATWGGQGFVRDGAAPWVRAPLDIDYQFTVAPDPTVADRTFFGTWATPYVTTDGTTFTGSSVSTNPMAFAFGPGTPSKVYMATEIGGIYTSSDGVTWTASSADIPPWDDGEGTNVDFRTILVDATNPQRVLAGSFLNGLWTSTDGAGTWTQASALRGFDWENLAQLTAGASAIFATVAGHGVQRSTDGGVTWTEVSAGLPSEDVNALVADEGSDRLYASTLYGVFTSADRGGTWTGVDTACAPAGGFGAEAFVKTTASRALAAVVAGGFGIYVHPL